MQYGRESRNKTARRSIISNSIRHTRRTEWCEHRRCSHRRHWNMQRGDSSSFVGHITRTGNWLVSVADTRSVNDLWLITAVISHFIGIHQFVLDTDGRLTRGTYRYRHTSRLLPALRMQNYLLQAINSCRLLLLSIDSETRYLRLYLSSKSLSQYVSIADDGVFCCYYCCDGLHK